MKVDLAGTIQGTPERFVPDEMGGQLIEAEHLSRYWWAAPLADRKRVLDAGCGTAYGSNILAEAGASEVVGVDIAEYVLEAVRPRTHPSVRLEPADVRELPFPDGSFDFIVSFELLEHLDEPEKAIGEFGRVLANEGLMAVSSPNRNVYVAGNPHHRHEFVPEELRAALARRFDNVQLFRQHDWMTAAILDDELFEERHPRILGSVELLKVDAHDVGSELYTIALASNGPLPEVAGMAVMTGVTQVREWLEHMDRLSTELRVTRREATYASERLLEAETALARVPILEAEYEENLAELRSGIEVLNQEVETLNETIRAMHSTRVWRLGAAFWRTRDRLLGRR